MKRIPKRPMERKRVPKPPHVPAYTKANHGLTQLARTENVSFATLYRHHVILHHPLQQSIDHCRANGLTWITRGQPRLGLRRNKAKPTP